MAAAAATATTPVLFSINAARKPRISISTLTLLSKPHFYPTSPIPSLRLTNNPFHPFRPCSAIQDVAIEEEEEEEEEKEAIEGTLEDEEEKRRKLFVVNLPWDFSASDIEKLFAECGTVKDVEIIKQKNGKSRGFAFITMASGEEASAVVEKFDSYELKGRIIRIEFAKSFRKPSPPPPPGAPRDEDRHKIYASNLAWKVRSTHLRDLFSEKFKPISARVVFDSPTGRSTGYGFVGFATKEEAEAAISELDGKELMGRPLRLKISQRTGDESVDQPQETDNGQQSE